MGARLRIGFGGVALVVAALALELSACDVSGPAGALAGLEAGIDGSRREFEALAHRRKSVPGRDGGMEPPAGRTERQVLRAMRANVASIRAQLPGLENCARNALLEAEGRPVRETAPPRPPPAPTVVGRRLGSARVEPGRQLLPARPCEAFSRHGTTTVYIFSDTGDCVRVGLGERLLFVNDTGIGPRHEGAAAVRALVGNYELWIEPRGSGLVPAPVETYLGRGSHRVRIAGAPGATILLLPPTCAMRPPPAPGEELCFR